MKQFRLLLIVILSVSILLLGTACGGKASESTAETSAAQSSEQAQTSAPSEEPVKITFLNSKEDINQQIVDAIQVFSAANPNITIEVLSTGQSPVEKAISLYASGTPATLCMLDAGDIQKFKDKAADLSNEKWAAELAQPNQIDGKTLAFPFAVEGYGLIYNKSVVEKAVGGSFDPSSINTTAALEDLFQKIQSTGVAPVNIGSMDWSLGNHFLALAYATQPDNDVNKFLDGLKSGTSDLVNNPAYNGLLDTFDVMKKYNMSINDPMAVTYEQSIGAVAKGEAAMTFNGNWAMMEIQKSNPDGEFGFVPVPVSNNASDAANLSIAVGATKQIFIDKEKSTDAQQAAAKKFLDWIVFDPAGQNFLVKESNIIPAYKNIALEPNNSLAKAIVLYNNAGKSIPFAGNFVPGDHWKVLGASMQKYLVDKIDRAELATDVEAYWQAIK